MISKSGLVSTGMGGRFRPESLADITLERVSQFATAKTVTKSNVPKVKAKPQRIFAVMFSARRLGCKFSKVHGCSFETHT